MCPICPMSNMSNVQYFQCQICPCSIYNLSNISNISNMSNVQCPISNMTNMSNISIMSSLSYMFNVKCPIYAICQLFNMSDVQHVQRPTFDRSHEEEDVYAVYFQSTNICRWCSINGLNFLSVPKMYISLIYNIIHYIYRNNKQPPRDSNSTGEAFRLD